MSDFADYENDVIGIDINIADCEELSVKPIVTKSQKELFQKDSNPRSVELGLQRTALVTTLVSLVSEPPELFLPYL